MVHSRLTRALGLCVLCGAWLWAAAGPARAGVLWQIGKNDNDTAEFAIGPDMSNQYSVRFPHGTLFVPGQSEAKQDWPYIQPGPADIWAGSKSHTFRILFGLSEAPTEGQCALVLDFVDTHSSKPPKLAIEINGRLFERQLPKGAGDASAHGQPAKGREHIEELEFPAGLLKAGTNEISITSATGSWILYDYVALTVPAGTRAGPLDSSSRLLEVHGQPYLVEHSDGKLYQPVLASVVHIGEPVEAVVAVDGAERVGQTLKAGFKVIEGLAPAVEKPASVAVDVKIGGKSIGKRTIKIEPVRKWQVYLLHHSHVDIGYTHVQTEVLQKHFGYFEQVIELARSTADYPEASRFKWNAEVLWAVDGYLEQASAQKRTEFIEAVKKGWIGLDALYGNELTALCRPEELVRLVGYARMLRQRYDVEIDSAMITDVPGYTWGIVPVLAQSGVKYFAVGPNRGHRIGYTLSSWGDKPFYWESPSGKERILCWVAGEGYSLFHSGRLDGGRLLSYLKRLQDSGYPYDMVHVRYSIGGDNGPPDPGLSDFVRRWNQKYAYPRLIISTASQMCREFEQRYGESLKRFRGDFTPYWEDGAGSSAQETALNRAAAERLVQAEALYAMLEPGAYPVGRFYQAWRNVILYDEHTWGAYCSISQPESEFTKAQWKIKQAFALDADAQSRRLLKDSLAKRQSRTKNVSAIDVINTCSWPRTDLVIIPKDWKLAGETVLLHKGRAVPAGRLPTGQIAFLAVDVPALGSKRFTLEEPPAQSSRFMPPAVEAAPPTISNSYLTVRLDENTGAICSIRHRDIPMDLAGHDKLVGLNDYFYVAGRDPKKPVRTGPAKISVKEYGRMMASLVAESDAPGCHKLTREVRLISGLERIDIIDTIDKKKVYTPEAVHLGFGFNVPGGVIRMDVPWGVVRPEVDQLPGACKNYFTVQRWVDVSNDRFGVTLATVDAPLIEVGAITNDPRGGVGWIKKLEPTTTLYSYVMNNYWETNYKASQEGPTVFRYSLSIHKEFDPAEAARFGIERSGPLIVVPVDEGSEPIETPLKVEPAEVIVTAFKPSDDGKARVVRLFNASGKSCKAKVTWRAASRSVRLSNLAEEDLGPLDGRIELAGHEFATLRIPLK